MASTKQEVWRVLTRLTRGWNGDVIVLGASLFFGYGLHRWGVFPPDFAPAASLVLSFTLLAFVRNFVSETTRHARDVGGMRETAARLTRARRELEDHMTRVGLVALVFAVLSSVRVDVSALEIGVASYGAVHAVYSLRQWWRFREVRRLIDAVDSMRDGRG